ncbi:MAG: ATP-binding cassette domain-containing protein [Anaerolineaceae bacterium]|nr:ATP-binding cassette domain-containing protein [Anaerolineaceae bacterium]
MVTTNLKRSFLSRDNFSLLDLEGAVIKMRNIVKKFKTTVGDVTVLKGIDTAFFPGEFVGVIGKSGSGKSTLVNMLTGIDRPTSGEVQIGETMVHRLSESQMARWRGLNLGIVFQFYQLLPVLTLLENTMLPMDIADKIPRAEREKRALALLNMVGLSNVAEKMPAAVSGGQQQAAAVARALANDPPFIIADEPTGNLDSRTAENIFEIFEGLVQGGKTIIMVTHDPNLAKRTSRTLLLCDGEVIHPAIAASLPWLTHAQMLRATHASQVQTYHPGVKLIEAGQNVDKLFILSRGKADVQQEHSAKTIHLVPGKVFGQVSLLSDKPALASVIAVGDKQPIEVLTLDQTIFCELIKESSAMRQALLTGAEVLV